MARLAYFGMLVINKKFYSRSFDYVATESRIRNQELLNPPFQKEKKKKKNYDSGASCYVGYC